MLNLFLHLNKHVENNLADMQKKHINISGNEMVKIFMH
jgi:hypothetical protein